MFCMFLSEDHDVLFRQDPQCVLLMLEAEWKMKGPAARNNDSSLPQPGTCRCKAYIYIIHIY